MSPLLTIAIPTYNRRKHVSLLLATLLEQLPNRASEVVILVSDNASPDGTSEALAEFEGRFNGLRVIRNAENIGADRNIVQCFETAETPFVWIMGDDDVPRFQVIEQLLVLLRQEQPDLLYIASEWRKHILATEIGSMDKLRWQTLDQIQFAHQVNVWTTFISGIIINKQQLMARQSDFSAIQYSGSNFIQLGWVLNALKHGDRFLCVSSRGIIATSGNTGGYSVVKAFGVNYAEVVRDIFGQKSPIAEKLVNLTLMGFLPSLIWSARFKKSLGNVTYEFPRRLFDDTYQRNFFYRLFVLPMAIAPRPVAFLTLVISKIFFRVYKLKG